MRDAIAWSYDLLTPEEQALFRRLAVFAGAFTLAAAEAVAAPEGDLPVFDGIAALIEQSFLRQAAGLVDEPRFVMLEIVREFGLEMLAAANETAVSRERHARYFLGPDDVPTPFAPVFDAPESSALLAAERDNVRLALVWLDEQGTMDELFSRTSLLYRLWLAPALYREGQQWIARALERSRQDASVVRYRALAVAANLAWHGGDYARAEVFAADALAIARQLDDPVLIGDALAQSGAVAYRQGAYGRAEELLLEAHELLRERAAGSWYGSELSLLGDTALVQGQFDQAAAWYAQSIEILKKTGHTWDLTDAEEGLGALNVCTGNLIEAAALYRDSLDRALDHGFTMLVSSALLGVAAIAVASRQPETGARLLGAAEGIAESLGVPIYPRDRPVRERGLDALQAALGEERLAAEREAGQALSIDVAVGEAMAVIQNVMRSLT
jgi:tetratricopeptide (TPR) repeat protein